MKIFTFVKSLSPNKTKEIKLWFKSGYVKVNSKIIHDPSYELNNFDSIFCKSLNIIDVVYSDGNSNIMITNDSEEVEEVEEEDVDDLEYINDLNKYIITNRLNVENENDVKQIVVKLFFRRDFRSQISSIDKLSYNIKNFFIHSHNSEIKSANYTSKKFTQDLFENITHIVNIIEKIEEYLVFDMVTDHSKYILKLYSNIYFKYYLSSLFKSDFKQPKKLIKLNRVLFTSYDTENLKITTYLDLKSDLETMKEDFISKKYYFESIFFNNLIIAIIKLLGEKLGSNIEEEYSLNFSCSQNVFSFEKDIESHVVITLENTSKSPYFNLNVNLNTDKSKNFSSTSIVEQKALLPDTAIDIDFNLFPLNRLISDCVLFFNISFNDRNNEEYFLEHELYIKVDNTQIDWDELVYKNPFNTGDYIKNYIDLYAREHEINTLIKNISNQRLSSFMIYGQKRIGKTSLIQTAFSEIEKINKKTILIYLACPNILSDNFKTTLNQMAITLISEINSELQIIDPDLHTIMSEFPGGDFHLLSHVMNYLKKFSKVCKDYKLIIALDEFDQMNEEFYTDSSTSKLLSGPLGKGTADLDNVSIIICGSENMKLYEKIGKDFNAFQQLELTSFRVDQKDEYFKMCQKPLDELSLEINPLVLTELYGLTGGNPFYTKLILKTMFLKISKIRKPYIDLKDYKDAQIKMIEENNDAALFQHFWSDSFEFANKDSERFIINIRRAILYSYALTYQLGKPFNITNIKEYIFISPSIIPLLKAHSIENEINNFISRKIFTCVSEKSVIKIVPRIFGDWIIANSSSFKQVDDIIDKDKIIHQEDLDSKIKDNSYEISTIINLDQQEVFDYLKQFKRFDLDTISALMKHIRNVSPKEIHFFMNEFYNKFLKLDQNVLLSNDISDRSNLTIKRSDIKVVSFKDYVKENNYLFKSFINGNFKKNNSTNIVSIDRLVINDGDKIVLFHPVIESVALFEDEIRTLLDSCINSKVSVYFCILISDHIVKNNLKSIINSFKDISFNINNTNINGLDLGLIRPFKITSEILVTQSIDQQFESLKNYGELNRNDCLILFNNHCISETLKLLWKNDTIISPLYKNVEDDNEYEWLDDLCKNTELHLKRTVFEALSLYLKISYNELIDSRNLSDFKELFDKKLVEVLTSKLMSTSSNESLIDQIDFINYESIINNNLKKIPELKVIKEQFTPKGIEFKVVMKILNICRRFPAHPTKRYATIDSETIGLARKILKHFKKI